MYEEFFLAQLELKFEDQSTKMIVKYLLFYLIKFYLK